ncbi:8541_t:CDS:2, partial [Racocetra persica]
LTPSEDRAELNFDLENLRKLIPSISGYNNSLSKEQNSAYQKKKSEVDKKELELIQALALLEDDENKSVITGNNQQVIKDTVEKLKAFREGTLAQIATLALIEELKTTYEKTSYNPPPLSTINFSSAKSESAETRILDAYKDIEDVANETLIISRIGELEKDLEKYKNLKLPTGRIIQFRNILDNKKTKLTFRKAFKTQAGNNNIDGAKIDAYFNKGLTAEQAAESYNYHNSEERIEADEINQHGEVEIDGKSYDLKITEKLTGVRQVKYIVVFLNAPASQVAGANHERINNDFAGFSDNPEIEEKDRLIALIDQEITNQQNSSKQYDSESPSRSDNNDNIPTGDSHVSAPDKGGEENSSSTSDEETQGPAGFEGALKELENNFQKLKEEFAKLSTKEEKDQ